MIRNFKSIKNFAIFKDFEWDQNVKSRNGEVINFERINIIYGRNYSGKTSLSRIIRSLGTGVISDKYDEPNFEVQLESRKIVRQSNLDEHEEIIRVYNEDFVRENLKFIFNPEEDIKAFAVLGESNNTIEKEIKELQDELGINQENKKTCLYKALEDSKLIEAKELKRYNESKKDLDVLIKNKALDKEIGIKYNSDKFGDQNYTTKKLKNEIKILQGKEFESLSKEQIKRLEGLLKETSKSEPTKIFKPDYFFELINQKSKELIEKNISESNKIEELVKDAVLNRWVSEGRKYHRNKREKCAFCGNSITENRWKKLDNHFDEESEKLKKDIDSVISLIENEKEKIMKSFNPIKDEFYLSFHKDIDELINKHNEIKRKYLANLAKINDQLIKRKESIISTFSFIEYRNFDKDFIKIYDDYNKLRNKSIDYTNKLALKQKEAQDKLRLNEVKKFTITINYKEKINRINELYEKYKKEEKRRKLILDDIKNKEELIKAKKRQLNDEEEGAKKVNSYLNNFFGHKYLSLKAIEKESEDPQSSKKIYFEIIRDDKKAHNLSEGECSLISFCYFMAKLEDISTKGTKPIIWIDDPISSLDGNHIFFIYSILQSKIVDKNTFKQLFISTHCLNFLKYLKRLKGKFKDTDGKQKYYQKSYFMINREDKKSNVLCMPQYLKNYITEFNYLFSQIYKCSTIDKITDMNYTSFYNFGNNARKFLEIYLYYKYPDDSGSMEKMKKFFEDDSVPSILTSRINNEYSHLSASFERGASPVDAPEMKSTAKLIIETIKNKDQDQYDALMNTISDFIS